MISLDRNGNFLGIKLCCGFCLGEVIEVEGKLICKNWVECKWETSLGDSNGNSHKKR